MEYFDLVMPAVSLAQGFGRIGSMRRLLLRQTNRRVVWITFRASNFAPNGVRLIPTQLISSIGDFISGITCGMRAEEQKPDVWRRYGCCFME